MADSKQITIRFIDQGLVTKKDPAQLDEGQYPNRANVLSIQEGSITSRSGSMVFPAVIHDVPAPHTIVKLSTGGGDDALNPRYVGQGRAIWRTTDYFGTITNVAFPVAPDPGTDVTKRWQMASYSSGSTGKPLAFFATPSKMLRDDGLSPYATLHDWGMKPAFGTAQADVIGGGALLVTDISSDAPPIVTTAINHGLSDHKKIGISGVVATTATTGTNPFNGSFYIQATGYALNQFSIYTDSAFTQPIDGTSWTYVSGGDVGTGNLSGNGVGSPPGSVAYDYLYTYVDDDTNTEGNPSVLMLDNSTLGAARADGSTGGSPISVNMRNVLVTVWGTGDTRVSKIAI